MVVIECETEQSFDSQLTTAGSKLVFVDFYATWCGPCKAVAPRIESMSTRPEYKNIVFLKVDVDKNKSVASRYSIRAMPTFIFIKSKQKLDEIVGADILKIQQKLTQYSSSSASFPQSGGRTLSGKPPAGMGGIGGLGGKIDKQSVLIMLLIAFAVFMWYQNITGN